LFPTIFMRFIHLIRSTSAERFDVLKNRIKARKATQYPGQNLTLHILNSFLDAGGTHNEDNPYPLRDIKTKLNAALLEIGYMDREVAQKYMAANKLPFLSWPYDLPSRDYKLPCRSSFLHERVLPRKHRQ